MWTCWVLGIRSRSLPKNVANVSCWHHAPPPPPPWLNYLSLCFHLGMLFISKFGETGTFFSHPGWMESQELFSCGLSPIQPPGISGQKVHKIDTAFIYWDQVDPANVYIAPCEDDEGAVTMVCGRSGVRTRTMCGRAGPRCFRTEDYQFTSDAQRSHLLDIFTLLMAHSDVCN